jgi:hypothetical protein
MRGRSAGGGAWEGRRFLFRTSGKSGSAREPSSSATNREYLERGSAGLPGPLPATPASASALSMPLKASSTTLMACCARVVIVEGVQI